VTVKLESLVAFLDEALGIPHHPDYPTALNGLQVGGVETVSRVAAAVDTSVRTISAAAAGGAQLMVVHHGAFWDGLRPITGRRLDRVRGLLDGGVALYSAHLPLDAHPTLGNCAILMREIGLEPTERFGSHEGAPLGWSAETGNLALTDLRARVEEAVAGPVQVIAGGGEEAGRVAVVTGGGGSFLTRAAAEGVGTLITGEGGHHTFVDAHELGINLIYAGHYATEVFGVKALGGLIEAEFGLDWFFVDDPSGL